uniref:Uncharacterized protein n=1 Tax=Panagrolaimus sp. ES5 TaxID=591445 RepID=A0AC34GC32_9BILA
MMSCSLPGTTNAPKIIKTVPMNPGCQNCNTRTSTTKHFPRLREGGGLTTPDGGRYIVAIGIAIILSEKNKAEQVAQQKKWNDEVQYWSKQFKVPLSLTAFDD